MNTTPVKAILPCLGILFLIWGCSVTKPNAKWAQETAPENFLVRFETSKGIFEVKVERALSPKAVDRFYQLVTRQYFENAFFYRTVPNFVTQFGSADRSSRKFWDSIKVPDEAVTLGNEKGTISFAREGKETRTTDLYINLVDNNRLDTINYNEVIGFPAFGRVSKGMDVVESLFSGYGETAGADFEMMLSNLDRYLKKYPEMDRIKKAYLVK
ncbi:MAG: peptidylprolyl isomerase [Flavobacteriaceae bacterium]